MTKKSEEKETPTPKQGELTGVEAPKVKDLDVLMEAQHKLGKKASKIREEQGQNNLKLIELMKKHKLEVYRDTTPSPPLTIKLKALTEKVKITEDGDGDESETWE